MPAGNDVFWDAVRRPGGGDRRRLAASVAMAVAGAVLAAAVAFAAVSALSGGRGAPSRAAARPGPAAAPAATPVAARPAAAALPPEPRGPFESLVAEATSASVDLYPSPGGAPAGSLANPNGFGARLVFLVRADAGGWLQVYVPTRPDGRTAWVKASQVRLSRDSYAVVVNLARRTAKVWNGTSVMLDTPAAVGRASTPTPTGTFYLAELLRQPSPSGPYGPYAYGLSAYSKVLFSFGGGPGQIGLHGTDEPGSIGRAASNGCVRVPDAVISRLAGVLPVGSPVLIGNWS